MANVSKRAGKKRSSGKKRVVVGVDGSALSDAALEWAAHHAASLGALLEVHCAWGPGYVFVTPEEIRRALKKVADKAAQHAVELEPTLKVSKEIHEAASPAKVLIDASDGAEALVVGSRGLGAIKGVLLGSVSRECSHHARCPVIIMRDGREDQ